MGPSQAGGGMVRSSLSSGLFLQGDMQSQTIGNAQLRSFENMANPIPGHLHPNVTPVSADISNNVMNSVPTSGPSIGASSMVTDTNSGGASINTESYTRLPASPLSFSSNNQSISTSSILDGPDSHQMQLLGHCQGPPTVTQLPPPWPTNGHDSVSHMQKKPRLDIKQEEIMQILQRQNSMQLQNPNPQLQALIQQQRFRQQQQQQQQQQQFLQSLPPVQRAHLQPQQQQQLQFRQGMPPPSAMKRPNDGGVCSRRLMQYMYHQRQRPPDNSIAYWRKFVAEYYSPRAKKRWCLSLYDNVGHSSLGVFPQAATDAWRCDICGSKSGRGFEATFEILPRLNEIKFSSGVIDELLFLGLPRESRFPSGLMMLEYGKAVQESVYEQLRVVREGQLKVIFTPDLKILTWEFCARRHEELLPRRLVAPQANQLLQVAQKCQSTMPEGGSDGVPQQDLQTNSNMVVTSWRQLARSVELQSINDLGFSKRYVRSLQISEVVSSMKDLMDFCQEATAGPREGLKSFPRQSSTANLPSLQGLPTDQTALNKLVPLHPGVNSPANGDHQVSGQGAPLSGPAQSNLTLTNYQNMLMRQKSMNINSQQESPSSNQNGWFQGWASQSNTMRGDFPNAHPLHHQQPPPQGGSQAAQQHMIQQPLQDMNHDNNNGGGGGGFPNAHLLHQHQQPPSQGGSQAAQQHMIQQPLQDMNNNNNGGGGGFPNAHLHHHQQPPSQGGSQAAQQHMIQQPHQDMNNNNNGGGDGGGGGGPKPSVSGQSGGMGRNGARGGGSGGPTRSNSFNSAGGGSEKAAVLPEDIATDFADIGFFNDVDFEDDLGFGWKV